MTLIVVCNVHTGGGIVYALRTQAAPAEGSDTTGGSQELSSPADVPAYPRLTAPSRRSGWLATAALLALAGIVTIFRCFHGFIDLDVYQLGVRQWLGGGDIYGTLPPTHDGVTLPFIYPPFAAIALLPLALIPWSVARMVNFGLTIAALTVTMYLSTRRLWPAIDRQSALVISGSALPLALWLEPVRETIGFGQVNLMLMMLVTADCLVEKPRWPRGLLVGIAAAIKLTPAVFLLYFLLHRDFRAAVVAIASGAFATAVGFAVLPTESMRYWFGGFASAAGVSGSPYANNQSLQAALARLSLPPLVQSGLWLLIAAVVLVAAGAGVLRALRRPDPVLAMTLTGAAGVLLSPVSWSHHWVWIVPALLAMAAETVRTRSLGWLVTTVVTIAIFSVGVHNFLPKGDGRELAWRAGEHLLGDSYVLLTLVLLIVWAVPAMISRPVPARSALHR